MGTRGGIDGVASGAGAVFGVVSCEGATTEIGMGTGGLMEEGGV